MNDTISRSALITELENRMVTAGDPVIKYLFARLIDIVKEQPAVKVPAVEEVAMIWVTVNHTHVNADNVDCFFWNDGELSLWYARDSDAVRYEDPDGKLYRKLCNDLNVKPVAEV